jgi:branched-chain amino acid transport system permease protein
MESLAGLATPIVIGILLGGLYVVAALGLSLVFGVMKVINVAHGNLVILGSYLAFAALTMWGLDPLLWLLPGIPLFFVMGILIEKGAVPLTSPSCIKIKQVHKLAEEQAFEISGR